MQDPQRYLVADVETTGIRPTDRIVEIAWVEITPELEPVEWVQSYIDPEMPIPAAASGVHHITNEMVADAPTIQEFFNIVRDGQNLGEFVLIAHNSAFDRRFLEPHATAVLGELCTLRLARRLYPDLDNHKLQTLRYEMGLDSGTAHSAIGDITALFSFLKLLSKDTGMSLPELVHLSKQPLAVTKMPFGKHRGEPLSALPDSYVSWLLTKADNIDDDLRFSLEQAHGR